MRSLRTVTVPKVAREGNSNPPPLGVGEYQDNINLCEVVDA